MSSTASPHDIYFATRTAFVNEHKDILGSMLIRGIQSDKNNSDDEDEDHDESDDEDNADTSKYTTEQMNMLRFIMITKNRDEQLDAMRKIILGDQADDSMLMFNTSFSYKVLDSWDHVKLRILPRQSASKKLDILIAYTYNLQDFDTWMHDNEGGMGDLVSELGSVWKKLLKNSSDTELDWDINYTKPGVLELLKQFKDKIDALDTCYDMGEFKYM
mmetsp:Transcript_43362/g.48803  ORF Transcript_43362/g.48803 Transcript_43362/m.48803 type:complete len:216 (+) Transcript_43362:110-757(+)